MANIIQAEFFHVGGRGKVDSFEEFLVGCLERVSDGSPIKTVVRFYDDDVGRITKAVACYQKLDRLYERLVQGIFDSQGLRRKLFEYIAGFVLRKKIRLKDEVTRLTIERLRYVSQTTRDIGLERRDYSFRLARYDELHELIETIDAAKGLWVFVFESDDLLADCNEMVASAM